jgi:hypothetical protein
MDIWILVVSYILMKTTEITILIRYLYLGILFLHNYILTELFCVFIITKKQHFKKAKYILHYYLSIYEINICL